MCRKSFMPALLSFEDAINKTDGEDRALLLGNGFSAKYFTYSSLLAASDLEAGKPIRNLFDALGTADFEAVVRALEDAAIVERAYAQEAHADELEAHAQEVREALVHALNKTHPTHRGDLDYASSAAFLGHFTSVFSLNYDLLLYWVNLEKGRLRDGFGLGSDQGQFRGPFSEEAHCQLFNIHGGLHLFDDGTGDIIKALDRGNGVIATISDTIVKRRRLPVYVAEGTSAQKMRRINSVAYLRRCYDMLRRNAATVFVYGHSADENDKHIYQAIFASEVKHIYFGVYKPDADKLKQLDGLLSKYQKIAGSDAGYSFYDSESAKVWEA
ncbi:MAG: hypothetical protein C0467_32820 [Planctomycetaceae bacterium]|nr:hypothetical protein [Planctomycetaceae bacterium]